MARSLRALSFLLLCLAPARGAWAAPPTITISQLEDNDPVKLTTAIAGTIDGTAPITVKLQVDGGAEVDAPVLNTGFLGMVTLPSEGPHTVTATATNGEGSASDSVTLIGDDTKPIVSITVPVTGAKTGDRTVDVTATVTDAHIDPNDPNTLFVNNTELLADPNTGIFHGRVPVSVGSHALAILARDTAGNVTTDLTDPNIIFVTRTTVCANPTFPDTDNRDPNQPHFFAVTRLDDLPLPAGFDPNSPDACDIRPDVHDPNDPNAFVPLAGSCTLRGALQVANAHPGVDVIRLPSDLVTLTRRGDGDDRGDLDVTDDLVIIGNGRDISRIDARKLKDRVFDVADKISFTIVNATVSGGQAPKKPAESGGCIRFAGGITDPNDPNHVATFRANNLALVDCKSPLDGGALELVQDPNAALPVWNAEDPNADDPNNVSKITCGIIARSSAKGDGGGISAQGSALVLRNSTIAITSSGANGGAVSVRGGKLVVKNATFSANKAKLGGGLALADGVSATVNNTTFARNKAKLGASISTSDEAGGTNTLVVGNSILGDSPKNTCDTPATSPLVSRGGNLDPGETCDLTDAQDQPNAIPQLDKLATNVGVPTHALKSDSPAIDHGVFARCEPLDERDADRVDGPPEAVVDPPNPDQCDSGSFEFASQAPPTPEPEPEKP